MIKLTGFIAAIQQAIDTASKLVSQENFNILKTYFDEEAPAAGVNNGAPTAPVLTPKMVAMKYPRETSKGMVEHQVLVPLISLTPFSNFQPSEITLEMDLEILEKGDDLVVGFPKVKKNVFGHDKAQESKPNAKLTMKINAVDRPAGITAIIEGYDKALRAQIPS